jgi:broad specificity phosphatase PhoE
LVAPSRQIANLAPTPLGESRCNVADRIKGVFGTILRDASIDRTDSIPDFIIVSHGVTIRAFRMQWNYSWEWCEKEKNSRNCSVRLIAGHAGGYADRLVFDGFEVAKASLQTRRRRACG